MQKLKSEAISSSYNSPKTSKKRMVTCTRCGSKDTESMYVEKYNLEVEYFENCASCGYDIAIICYSDGKRVLKTSPKNIALTRKMIGDRI